MVEIRTARSGLPTAFLAGGYLHSPYDPAAEAERFVRNRLGGQKPATVLLLGAELGHAQDAILLACPGASLLSVFYDSELAARSAELGERGAGTDRSAARPWQPGAGETLLDFLRRCVDELGAEGLAVVEWPASARLFPQASLAAHRQTAQLLRELRGSLATTAVVGRRWLCNSLLNFVGLDRVLTPPASPGERPILIAASGPTLEKALPPLADLRGRFSLWALPSAVENLMSHGLDPDLVVLTDPSWYARAHLFCLRRSRVPLAMPLTAAQGAWRSAGGVLLLAQDSAYEQALLEATGYPAPRILPQGTVAATAIELALRCTRGPVILAGLDLCFADLQGHARPNLFERTLAAGAFRLSPFQQRLFAWAAAQAPRRLPGPGHPRSGLALDTYAGWFAGLHSPAAGRLQRLLPSAVHLPGIPVLEEGAFRGLLTTGPAGRAPGLTGEWGSYPDFAARRRLAASLLADWQERLQRALARVRGESSIAALAADALLASLTYHFDAARTAELYRVRRLQGEKAAAGKADALLHDQARFLAGWHSRLAS